MSTVVAFEVGVPRVAVELLENDFISTKRYRRSTVLLGGHCLGYHRQRRQCTRHRWGSMPRHEWKIRSLAGVKVVFLCTSINFTLRVSFNIKKPYRNNDTQPRIFLSYPRALVNSEHTLYTSVQLFAITLRSELPTTPWPNILGEAMR